MLIKDKIKNKIQPQNWYANKDIKICELCYKVITTRAKQYCSVDCFNKSRLKPCISCGKLIPKKEGYFCNNACYTKYLSSLIYICEYCKKEFVPIKTYQKRCSKECVNKHKYKTYGNKYKSKEYDTEYRRIKIKTDIKFKLKIRLRNRFAKVIKKGKKIKSVLKLLGCSIDYFKNEYLPSLFTEGMSWENYGKWHIDHIIPCASFDFTKIEDQEKCFNYTNLQPLWADDNLKKGAKII